MGIWEREKMDSFIFKTIKTGNGLIPELNEGGKIIWGAAEIVLG